MMLTLWWKILNALKLGRDDGGCHGEGLHIKGDNLTEKDQKGVMNYA